MPGLADLGWNDRLADAFVASGVSHLVPARVSLEHTHIYRVLAESGEWLARVSGRLRHQASARADFPAVGDWVVVEPPQDDGADGVAGVARIRSVLPRASRFSRRAAGDRTEEQVVAANIDVVFLVSGLDGDYNLRRIERYLLVALDSGATRNATLSNPYPESSGASSVAGSTSSASRSRMAFAYSARLSLRSRGRPGSGFSAAA